MMTDNDEYSPSILREIRFGWTSLPCCSSEVKVNHKLSLLDRLNARSVTPGTNYDWAGGHIESSDARKHVNIESVGVSIDR